eukprot:g41748.t1
MEIHGVPASAGGPQEEGLGQWKQKEVTKLERQRRSRMDAAKPAVGAAILEAGKHLLQYVRDIIFRLGTLQSNGINVDFTSSKIS